jgi:hypothetical protein
MKTTLLYIFISLLLCAVLLGISSARADTRVVIKNKCNGVTDYQNCMYKTQGASNEYRLEAWEDLKKQAIKKGYKLPAKVVLIDPIKPSKGVWEYKTYLKGKVLYFSPMQPCRHVDRREGLRALRGLR